MSDAYDTLRQRLEHADWWTSPRIRSICIFVNVFVRASVKAKLGYRQLGAVKATTIHQEFRVLRRILNVAVRKRLLPANPCAGAEFPVAVKGLFRPHYVTWSEQQRIESSAPQYLRNVVRIITETGLRIYKELISMRKAKWICKMRLSGYRIRKLRPVLPKFPLVRWLSRRSRTRWHRG